MYFERLGGPRHFLEGCFGQVLKNSIRGLATSGALTEFLTSLLTALNAESYCHVGPVQHRGDSMEFNVTHGEPIGSGQTPGPETIKWAKGKTTSPEDYTVEGHTSRR